MTIKPRHPEKVNKPVNPIKKKPDWIRSKLTNSKEFFLTKTIVNQNNLVTVCQEANCPNITECWSKRHATFMIMGDTCTRACAHTVDPNIHMIPRRLSVVGFVDAATSCTPGDGSGMWGPPGSEREHKPHQ